ncbi:MAG: hypothetical protein JWO30_1869 [Fibrobacteres bacterium]|nr:hypothetical protein [Fibrobacterota bacterium]
MMSLNFILLQFIVRIFGWRIFFDDPLPNSEIVAVLILTLSLNYFLFLHKDKYKKLIEKYAQEPFGKRNWKALGLLLYIGASFSTVIYLAGVFGSTEPPWKKHW